MENEKTFKKWYYMPFLFAIVLAGGIYLGNLLHVPFIQERSFFSANTNQFNKFSDVLTYIQQEYVDTVDRNQLVNVSIEKMLQSLDPHSAYIPAEDLKSANEPLEGNFEGIGVEFHLQNDTIMVVSAISGGPSESVGIKAGDRIVMVDDTVVAGVNISNSEVMQKLRGPGGTKVKVKILRRSVSQLLDFTITRGKIPIYSLDASFMVNDSTGYFKISRFAATTYDEFMQASIAMKKKGMKQLIIDFRGNPGGYLDAATKLADEFLGNKKTVVYTEGKARPRTNYEATGVGEFENAKVVILIDEGSASASEIVAGALQDWDRATIVGRRSFGKGLVQEQTVLPDGSALRLTIARYYTPTGRSIQKPYKDGYDEYNNELNSRFDHNELLTADSIHFPDSLKFKTPGGKFVYGGGGIMPDVFVPIDTTGRNNEFLIEVINKSVISEFAFDYVDVNRARMKSYKSFTDFKNNFQVDKIVFDSFIKAALAKDVKKNDKEISETEAYLKNQIKAFIGRQVFKNEGFYPILLGVDKTFLKAIEVINAKPGS
ncbi:MAG: S41 family peptidase [Bacteroidetes bacterium]|nr:S41 family peptidase [Bacteroidota bacterium]